MRKRWVLPAVLLSFSVAPVQAETLKVWASDPAGSSNVNDLLSITVERFEGADGSLLSQALEAELASTRFAGRPYFRVVAPESRAPVDALITGGVRSNVEESGVIEKRKQCVEEDPVDKKKCLKEAEVDMRCRRRVATVSTHVRLVALGDGSIRYTRPMNARDEIVYCPDRKAARTVETFIETAVRGHVEAIRRDLAPGAYTLDVRVDENRKGLPKASDAAFRAAIRQTKSDEPGACESWAAIARDVEPTAALAFNLGLCAEARRDFAAAVDWYGQARQLGSRSRDIADGIARIGRTQRALADWEVRQQMMDRE